MENILKSYAGRTADGQAYLTKLLNGKILSQQERDVINYLCSTFTSTGKYPTEVLLADKHPVFEPLIPQGKVLPDNDLEIYIAEFVTKRRNLETSRRLMEVASKVTDQGFDSKALGDIKALYEENGNEIKVPKRTLQTMKDAYEEKKNKPTGLLTGVKEIDDAIGGMVLS